MNFEEQYLGLIIETYEREVMRLGSVKGYKVLTSKSVSDLKSVTSTCSKTIDSFPGSKYDLEKHPEDVNKKTDKKPSKDLLKKNNIPLAPEELNDYLARCFGCDLRLQWDWQFLPPDFALDSMLGMLDDIFNALKDLEKVFNTKKKIEQICSLPTLFGGIPCPQDILNIVMGLKLLIAKYTSIGLKLKIDWFVLLGPIISSIVNILNYLVNFIFDVISAPLDCSITTMNSGLSVLRVIDSELFTTKPSGGSVDVAGTTEEDTTKNSILGRDFKTTDTVTGSASTTNNALSMDAQAHNTTQYKSFLNGVSDASDSSAAVPSGITTGFNIQGFLNNVGTEKPSFMDLSMPEQMLIGVVEAKDYISFYRSKILEVLDALRGLVKGSKLVDIQNMSILIVLAEMLAMLLQLLNTDFKKMCDSQNKANLEVFVKSFIAQTDDSISIDITTSDIGDVLANITELQGNTISQLIIKPCSKANTTQDLKQVENILAEIERLTRNG